MERWISRLAVGAVVGAVQLGLAAGASAQGLLSESEASAAIGRDYGVEVLDIEPATIDGSPVFRVTVMNPGGNYNEAFMVTTLILDRQTGQLVRTFRQGAQGAESLAPGRREAGENSGPALRRRSLQ